MPDTDLRPANLSTYLHGWHPDPTITHDQIAPAPARALAAVLDLPEAPTATLPPLWQWLYFLNWPAQSDLGPDGHPSTGTFMPPIPQRTRMFGGGRLRQHHPLVVGAEATKTSSLARVELKNGSSGELAFVTVRSEFTQSGRLCAVEEQDFVYRSGVPARVKSSVPPPPAARTETDWRQEFPLDETVLFRFSALTANAHRIHYDADYATGVEGHPALVVHGPLLVLSMAELARSRSDRPVESISYRLRRPVYLGHDVDVTGTITGDGAAMTVDTDQAVQHATATIGFST